MKSLVNWRKLYFTHVSHNELREWGLLIVIVYKAPTRMGSPIEPDDLTSPLKSDWHSSTQRFQNAFKL